MKINQTQIRIIHGDITELKVDAIVNPANNDFKMEKGLAAIIKMKGGLIIEEEAILKDPTDLGKACFTEAGHLSCKYVIHAVTMSDDEKPDEHIIRSAVKESLKCADELIIHSLAFPALGCGEGGFPKIGCAKIMAQEVLRHCRASGNLKEIIFCLYDDETHKIFKKEIPSYINHIQNDLGLEPYVTVDVIIELKEGIVLIERSNPPYGWALPGGFLDKGESLEVAVKREAMEETNLELKNLKQFHTYSEPTRDPRFHTISTVFVAKGVGKPQFGDDAKGLKVVPYKDLLKLEYAFDHKQVIRDYLNAKKEIK